MSEAVIAAAQPLNALERWLRFDRSIDVERAYRDFVRSSPFGISLVAAFFLACLFVVLCSLILPFREQAASGATLILYLVPLLALRSADPDIISRVLRGRIDLRRGFLIGVGAGVLIVGCEFAAALLMAHAGLKNPPDAPQAGGVVAMLIGIIFLTPIVEEFALQGWLQTLLLRFGVPVSVIATTVIFVLIHGPSNPFDFVRAGGLLAVALVRAHTGSLGACIAMHGTNNFLGVMLTFLVPPQIVGVHT